MSLACLTAGVVGALLVWAPGRLLRVIGAGAACAAGAAALTWVSMGIPAVTLVAAAVAAWSPTGFQRARSRRERERRREAWPDAIDGVRAALRAGAPLGQAVADAAERVPEPLKEPFREAAAAVAFGRPTRSAVTALAVDPVGIRVVAIIQVADEVGSADIGVVLDALGCFLRADSAQRREVAARHSWNVAAARLAVLAPWLTVAALSLQPEGRAAYSTRTGTLLLIAVAGVTAVAYGAMSRAAAAPDGES